MKLWYNYCHHWLLFLFCCVFLNVFVDVVGEIHRAKPHHRHPYRHTNRLTYSMFTDHASDLSNFLQQYQPWICSVLASILVGLSGIMPLLVIPLEAGASLKTEAGSRTLRLLLSFAVGGLLGDVFLHLLPEAWKHLHNGSPSDHLSAGLWVLAGMFTFIIVEMMFTKEEEIGSDDVGILSETNGFTEKHKVTVSNGHNVAVNGMRKNAAVCNGVTPTQPSTTIEHSTNSSAHQSKNISGYLNLLANSVDNFTHGLAVAGSFLVSMRVGMLTTLAILLHEIPHEIGDFAILLKAGFTRCEAAKAQIGTAAVGLLGALMALGAESAESLGNCTAWILPFTSGGFINIALVTVLPDLVRETDPIESLKQIFCVVAGIAIMGIVTLLSE